MELRYLFNYFTKSNKSSYILSLSRQSRSKMSVYGVEDGFKPESESIAVGVTSGDKMYMRQAIQTNPAAPYTSLLATVILPTENSGIADVELQLTGSMQILASGNIFNAGALIADIFAVHDPLGSLINTITVTTGGQSFSKSYVGVVQQALDRYFPRKDNIKDTLQISQKLANTASYGNTFTGEKLGVSITKLQPNAAGVNIANIDFDIVGRIPFELFDKPLFGLNTYNIQIVFNSMNNLFRIVNTAGTANYTYAPYAAGAPFSNMTATLYYTAIASKTSIPKSLTYKHTDIQITQSQSAITINAATPDAQPPVILTGVATSQTITSSTIPTGYLIFATTSVPATPEITMLPITSLNVNFMNKSSLLSNASQYQLYKICKNNGFVYDFSYFKGSYYKGEVPATPDPAAANSNAAIISAYFPSINGNPIYVTPQDLNIEDGLTSSMSKQCQFYCTATIANTTTSICNDVILWVVPVFTEQLTITGNSCSRDRGFVKSVPTHVVKGGSFLEDLVGTVTDLATFNIPGIAKRLSGG